MENIQELLSCKLFSGISEYNIEQLLEDSDYYIKDFFKGADIYPADSQISHAGIILSGDVDVLHTSVYGDEEIVGRDCKGDIIGPAFCITGACNNLTQFRVRNHVKVLFLNINKILEHPACNEYYSVFVRNLTNILANNNIVLNRKIKLLTRRSLREKLMVYFAHLSDISGSESFELPFTREQLAQYICSERSSVCRELGRMQDEGLIKVSGNTITILSESFLL